MVDRIVSYIKKSDSQVLRKVKMVGYLLNSDCFFIDYGDNNFFVMSKEDLLNNFERQMEFAKINKRIKYITDDN